MAVEKLASEKSAKIKMRQEAPQTIFSSRLDIFYPQFLRILRKRDFFNSHRISQHLSNFPSEIDRVADYPEVSDEMRVN
ncbi:MAG: hypothetical protein WB723_02020 [Candidatus Acidiferrales bacterium]